MSLFVRLGESGSRQAAPQAALSALGALTEKFWFLPPEEVIDIPPGWFTQLVRASQRLSCVVPVSEWGTSFWVTSVAMKDGGLDIGVIGGPEKVSHVLRKVRRASMCICTECGTPGILYQGNDGLRPHCPKCLHKPALKQHLDEVLTWRAGLEGRDGQGVRLSRVPPTLRPSFRKWLAASGLDARQLQPWDLEPWLRDLARAQRALGRGWL